MEGRRSHLWRGLRMRPFNVSKIKSKIHQKHKAKYIKNTKQIDMFGFIFECLCIRDLKIYSQALNGKVSYYHDRYDLEADAVLHIGDGRYALIEFKLGSAEIDEGAKHLLKIRELIREYNKAETQVPLREPDLLMVITGGNVAYTREDGVKVIPIACLKD